MKTKSITQRTLAFFLSIMMFLLSYNIMPVSSLQDDTSSSNYTANFDGRISGSQWEFDVYYMNQDDKYYVEKNDDFNLKYQMEFHSSRDLEANSVEIRIPATLLEYRDGEAILPAEIALPQGTPSSPVESRVTAFNYYIDNDDLVFFNYEKIKSGINMAWQVLYKNLDAIKITDKTEWSLEPTITVQIDDTTTESKTAKALEGLVDTSVTLQSVSKEILRISKKSYGPGLYTQRQVEEYISGKLPSWCSGSNFDKYVYVVWDVKATGNGNQPWSMALEDISKTENGYSGYVVGYRNSSSINKYSVIVSSNVNGSQDTPYTAQIVESSSKEKFELDFYVVSAYPKNYVSNGTILNNNIDITLTPLDNIDSVQTKSDSAEWSYSNYSWKYAGYTIGIDKYAGYTIGVVRDEDIIKKGLLEVYKEASNAEEDKVKLPYISKSKCNGYNFTHNVVGNDLGKYIDGTSYTVSTFDDVLYAYPSGGDKTTMQMLNGNDYYFTKVVVTQVDEGYDVWEDQYTVPESVDAVDQSVTIYAMYENSTTWESVATVPWSSDGIMKYTFTDEQLARKPWRVRADHTSINYLTTCTIGVEVCLRHNSQTIKKILEDNDSLEELVIQNLSGVTGQTNSGGYFHDSGIDNYLQYSDNLQEVSNNLYNTLPMRDNAEIKITNLIKQADSYKAAKTSNDIINARANVAYTITAYDGYEIYNQEAAEYLLGKGLESPGRNEVVFYDLLPYGMKFDPSKPITAGRITNLINDNYQTQYKIWNKNQVTVKVDTEKDVIDNYKGTGRTMVVFHISYSGEDSSAYSNSMWFEGWGVNFSAYYEWKDIQIVKNSVNISAFMPEIGDEEPLLGLESQVWKDDGNQSEAVYKDFGEDINADGIKNIRNILYAKNSEWEDIVTAASSKIEKLVKADSDIFGVFRQEAAVEYDSGYTYEITLSNIDKPLKDIVIYDKLENSIVDRGSYDSLDFEDNSWHGTFNSIITKGLEQLGVKPVIYYNENRNVDITTGNSPSSENGWYTATQWEQMGKSLSNVQAVAVDISKKTDGEDFILDSNKSISFQIKMTSPKADEEQLKDATYAYNNTAYYSYSEDTDTSATVISNSTRVKINKQETLEVQKEFDGEVPEQLENNSFEFYLYQEGQWNNDGTTEKIKFNNKEYKLFTKDEDGKWVQSDGIYATDANGMLALHADEKAVFEALPDVSSIIVQEEDNIFWESTITNTTEEGTNVHTYTVKNKFNPILYLQKQLKSVPDGLDVSNYEFTFQILADGEPLANTQFWYVDKVLTNGGTPNKIGAGTSDANGCVKIRAGQIIAISPGNVGTNYEVTEIDGATDADNWICENQTVKGTVSINGSLATITNVYRLKDLCITKEITHQDASKCTQEFTFKITDSNDTPTVGNEWVLLDSNGDETDTKGKLNENGEFTVACAGQTVKVKGFRANETYTVQETQSGELYKAVNGGIAEVTMPLYSSSANVTITNDWQKRPLSVSKVVMYDVEDTTKAEAVAGKSFTMTATVNGQLVADYPYTVVDRYGNSSTGQTDINGQFQIKNGETVTFEDIGIYGESFTITETPDSDYPQIYPVNAAPYTGTLSQDENKVCFVNGSGKNLIISKQYVGNDPVSNDYVERTKTDVSLMLESNVFITLKYKYNGVTKVWPETDTPVQIVALDGSVTQKTWPANSSMSISEWVMVIIPENAIPSDAVYYVSEREKDQHRLFYHSYREDDGSVKMYYLEINQKVPENDAPVTGTIESSPVAMIINEVKVLNVGSVVEKRMSVGSDPIPTDARLVWRVERYTDGKWQPAENIKYMVNTISVANREIVGDKAMYTGSDGIIELTKKENHSCPIVKFIDAEVSINVQNPVEGQLRVIELQDESDKAWGMLAGYGNADDLSVSTSLDSENAVAFVNSNVNTPVEIEKVMETDCDETFAMTLRQVISSSEYPITKTSQITETVIRGGIPYIVYDSETGDKVSEGVTDKDGNIYLKAGQFARLELPDSTVWTVSEETNPQYKLKSLSGSPEDDERLIKLNDNLMLIKQQYPFVFEDIAITAEMVEKGYVYDGETGEKVILNTGDVTIPEYIIWNNQKYRVTSIGDNAFENCTGLRSITIPDSVTRIGNYAFRGCTNLRSITIPDSVTRIGNYAFYGCKSLTSITIPDSVEGIEIYTFYGCESLTSITIPSSVEYIANYAFYGCKSLTSITIPNSVEDIGDNAFYRCTSLTSITIPNSVTSIGDEAFFSCTSLRSITIPNSVTSIGKYAFESCTSLTSITIPNSVTSIGNEAFANCTSLRSITIPNSVTSIGKYAFRTCASLTSITIPDSVTRIGTGAFFSCTSLRSITIPNSVTNIETDTFRYCRNLTSITIPNSVRYIGDGAFANCTGLRSITISIGVTAIGSEAFMSCISLTSITIPRSVVVIGSNAFRGCGAALVININKAYGSISGSPWGATSATVKWTG